MITIEGMQVDDEALFGIAHGCEPDRYTTQCTCCKTYHIGLGKQEIPLLDGCIANACACACANPDDVHIVEDEEGFSLETDEEGQCLLTQVQPNGATYCGLHAAALKQGLDPYTHKPLACTLWPVATTDDAPVVIGITPDAFEFPCNRRRRGTPATLHAGIAEILDKAFGQPFREKLEHTRQATPSR